MKKSLVLGAFVVAASVTPFVASTADAQVAISGAGSVAPLAPEVTVSAITLSSAAPKIVKTSAATPSKAYSVEFEVKSSASISTGKFQLGGMDSDTGATSIANIPKDKCGRYLMNISISKKNGANWDNVLVTKAHGVWYDTNKPGEVDRCKLMDGFGVSPKTWSSTLTKPGSGSAIYRVVVSAGFAPKAWPASANEQITEFRQVVATIAQAN